MGLSHRKSQEVGKFRIKLDLEEPPSSFCFSTCSRAIVLEQDQPLGWKDGHGQLRQPQQRVSSILILKNPSKVVLTGLLRPKQTSPE